VEARATEALKKGVFTAGPLGYLQACSSSREALTALENMSLPTQALERMKALAIAKIRFRIEHPAGQVPAKTGAAQR
jgi:hypothetical protein